MNHETSQDSPRGESVKQLGYEIAERHGIPPESLNSVTVETIGGGRVLLGFADTRPRMGYYDAYTCTGKKAGHHVNFDVLGKHLLKHHSSELLIEKA